MVREVGPGGREVLAAVVGRARRSAPGFARRWGVPIPLGDAAGFLSVSLGMDTLTTHLGAVAGGALASLAAIGLGVAVAAVSVCAWVGRLGSTVRGAARWRR